MLRVLIAMLFLALAACASQPVFDPATPPLVLTGEITRADHQTYREPVTLLLTGQITRADHQAYRELPFVVPAGTTRITIDFTYDKENRTVIDLGLRDPNGQRGWSGGNKARFTIGQFEATPSYRPGLIQPGEWKLILGVPNIREGQTANYTATIRLDSTEEQPVHDDLLARPVPDVLSPAAGWYRGDFHMHTGHSDGSCEMGGVRGPCPPERTFSAARDAGLDFAAITDHNTITQFGTIRFMRADFPKTLLIPGTEVTTFFGHANVVGNSDFVDFQLGNPRLPTLSKLFDEADAQGAFVSVNHPSLPSGEICMGCGWTVKDTDWSRVTSIEVINGGTLRTSGSDVGGIAFWEKLLNQGYRITAIGGSDNHDATDRTGAKQSPVGKPTTVVYADELSTRGIVAGVKSGRVFIDVAGLPDATLDIAAVTVEPNIVMGGAVRVPTGGKVTLDVRTTNLPDGARVEPVSYGVDAMSRVSHNTDWYTYFVTLQAGHDFGWFRANVRDASGKLLLLGNPIYFTRAVSP